MNYSSFLQFFKIRTLVNIELQGRKRYRLRVAAFVFDVADLGLPHGDCCVFCFFPIEGTALRFRFNRTGI